MKPLSDRDAVRLALYYAFEWEESLIDAYRNVTGFPNLEPVERAQRNIAAFRRVLKKRYGVDGPPKISGGKSVDLFLTLRKSG